MADSFDVEDAFWTHPGSLWQSFYNHLTDSDAVGIDRLVELVTELKGMAPPSNPNLKWEVWGQCVSWADLPLLGPLTAERFESE